MTKLLKESDMAQGVAIIKQGGLVAFRTETVYGLGADATNDNAVKKIFIAKSRPQTNPLIVHFHSLKHLKSYIDVPQEILPLFRVKGALTVVLKKGDCNISQFVTGGQDTVACRIPACGFAKKFIKAAGVPIAAPSANTSTRPSPTRWQDVYDDLNNRIEAIFMGGQTKIGVESTVVLWSGGKINILRQGGVDANTLEKITKLPVAVSKDNAKLVKSPGTKFKHYTPNVPLHIIKEDSSVQSDGVILCRTANKKKYPKTAKIIPLGNTAKQIQANLFAAFRDAEKLNPIQILIEQMPNTEEFSSINDRIQKAATK